MKGDRLFSIIDGWTRFGNRAFLLSCIGVALWFMVTGYSRVSLADEIQFVRDGQTIEKQGRLIVEAQDGGVLFLASDGKLWLLQPDEIKSKNTDESTREFLDVNALGKETLKQLPEGFKLYTSRHFAICYNTSRDYARWVASVYERLYRGFQSYWTRKGRWKIHEPEGPMAIVLFQSRDEYSRFVRKELGTDVGTMVAYYNLLTNRVAMYDLTGLRQPTRLQIINFLKTKPAQQMIATMVHEGTHQLIFNSGIQTRLADTPLWVNEGLAMYFETPDLNNRNGWRTAGALNRPRLVQFRRNQASRKLFTIEQLIANDQAFQNAQTASDAYAQAWAFNYFLLKKRTKKYVSYLQELAKKKPLGEVSSESRVAEFKSIFGDDLNEFQEEFLKYMNSIR